MWNPFSKESVLRDLRSELSKIEKMDEELSPTLEKMAEATPAAPPGVDVEPFCFAQRFLETNNSLRGIIEALEQGFATVGETRARTAFLAGDVREFGRQLTRLKRKDYWIDPAISNLSGFAKNTAMATSK